MVDGWIADNLGKKWYAIQADYAWGYENMEGLQAFIKTGGKGAELLGSTKTPLGTSDFSSFIPAIRAAKPDVVQIFVAGGDFIAFIRQAHQYGLHKEMKLWSPVVDAVFDEQAGYENIEGTYGGAIFDWQMEAANPLAKQLVDASVARYKRPISSYGAIQYVAIKQWAEAVKKANSLDPDKVAAALNGTEFDTPWGKSHLRACDHQIVAPLQVTVGMSQQDAQALGGQFANLRFRKILTTIPASDDSLPSCQELGF
jgi:branched-chain amino acid transport system substrate-binding protein